MGQNRVDEAIIALGDTLRIGTTFIRLLPDVVDGDGGNIPTARIVIEENEDLPAVITRPPRRCDNACGSTGRRWPALQATRPAHARLCQCAAAARRAQRARRCRSAHRKSQPIAIDKANKGRPSEALEAFRQLLFVAIRTRATDIHIEPKPDIYTLRFRIDGMLHSVGEVTAKVGVAKLNVVKILCQADIAKRSVVQEGNFAIELPNRRCDMRVNMTPTVHGQKLALRFLDRSTVPDQFENLGMELDSVAELRRVCSQDAGLVIIAGPTAAEKTTTLYTALKTVDAQSRNIVTIEDPVEYELPNATQISIDAQHGLTFASVLSSILRQDPDVILVGEGSRPGNRQDGDAGRHDRPLGSHHHSRPAIRSVRSSACSTLGVEPFLIANSVTLCITQRLIRVLCPDCKRAFRPDARMVRELKLEDRPHGNFYTSVGCKRCMDVASAAAWRCLKFSPSTPNSATSS